MWRKTFCLSVAAIVLGFAGGASGIDYLWTNDGDANSWCNRFNWDPNTSVPGSEDSVTIRRAYITQGPLNRGPIVDCDVDVGFIDGPGNNQVMDVISGTVHVVGDWDWQQAGGQATINITGSPTISVGGSCYSPKEGTGTLNISGNPAITIGGVFKTANDGGSWFTMNMSGGSLSVGSRLGWGEDGGGELNVSGGATIECGELDYTGRGGEPWTLNLNGGTITVIGRFRAPEEAAGSGNITINLDAGILECGSFSHGSYAYAMDVNEGMFIIDGDVKADMEADVQAGYVTAFDGTAGVIVTYDEVPGKTIVKADYVQVKASNPSPANYDRDVCPGVELSWQAGAYAVDHNVYFGPSLSDVNESAEPYLDHYGSTQCTPSGLALGTKYYWRVDEVDDANVESPWVGDIWEFTTNDGNASEPYPADKKTAVPANADLYWTPGCGADSHDVYFGTDYNDVRDATSGSHPNVVYENRDVNNFDPGTLDYLTWYYWRIDEVDDGTRYKGKVWSFRSVSEIVDPHLILWYKLDESEGAIVSDSSGYEHHGSGYRIAGQWEPNNGQIDGCLDFDADQHVLVPSDTLDSVTKEITVTVWVNGYRGQDEDDDMIIFDAGDLGGGDYKLTGIVPTEEPGLDVYWQAGNDTNDLLLWTDATPDAWKGDWHHFAFVKDENEGKMYVFFDGFLRKSQECMTDTLANVKNKTFKIGSQNNSTSSYDGKLDDFRVYDRALSSDEIQEFIRGDLGVAWAPRPYDGKPDVAPDVNLIWNPGNYAASHEVYLGTDWDDVNSADTTDAAVYRGWRNLDANSYNPGVLELDTTYYWRIDEVNGPNTWKGGVWRFTMAGFLMVDDMESYVAGPPSGNEIYDTWDDGFANYSGAQVFLEYASGGTIHEGQQSMKLAYDNAVGYYKYSEIDANTSGPQPGNLTIGTDWTVFGVRALTLFFNGDPTNDANEQMYLALEDGSANIHIAEYGDMGEDMNDIKTAEWQQWNIPLSDFNDNGVILTDITKVRIGFGDRTNPVLGGSGIVFFDDIRLYLPKCVPSIIKPQYDLSDNCIVDFADVAILADDWLLSDVNLNPVAPPASPAVLRYQFDESSGTTVADSVGGYTGVFFTDMDQTPAEISGRMEPGRTGSSFHFYSDEYGAISIPDTLFTAEGISQQITVAVWIKNAHPEERPDGTAFMWEFREWDGISVDGGPRVLGVEVEDNGDDYVFHDSSENVAYRHDWDSHTDWQHYAFVRTDANLAIYVDGVLAKVSDSNGTSMAAPGLLYVGMAADRAPGNTSNMHDGFTGNMDDWEIYDYALSDADIGYLGTGGTGISSVRSPANVYNEEPEGFRSVNFRDFDFIAGSWLEEILWP